MPTQTAPPQDTALADLVRVQRRFLRSVNLERDFYSPDPLDGYLLTASAVVAFDRLAAGIAQPHARAFSLTGPYGSGKSAFALFASKALAPASLGAAPLRERLRGLGPEGGRGLFARDEQGFWPVLITGTREALAPALRRGLFDALDQLPAPAARVVRERLEAEALTPQPPFPQAGEGEHEGAESANSSTLARLRERVASLSEPGEGRLRPRRAG